MQLCSQSSSTFCIYGFCPCGETVLFAWYYRRMTRSFIFLSLLGLICIGFYSEYHFKVIDTFATRQTDRGKGELKVFKDCLYWIINLCAEKRDRL